MPGRRSVCFLSQVIGKCVLDANYPEPTSASPESAMTFDLNSDSKMSGPLYRCTSSGEWQVQTGKCFCSAGYEPDRIVTRCSPCASGTHKYVIDEEDFSYFPVSSLSSIQEEFF